MAATPVDTRAPFRPFEENFISRFLYYANAPADLETPPDRLFNAGVEACELLRSNPLPSAAKSVIVDRHAFTQDGADSVASAAVETMCPETAVLIKPRTVREADSIVVYLAD